MDKINLKWWMFPRWSKEYRKGVDEYIEKAFANEAQGEEIRCPCKVCHLRNWLRGNVVKDHMIAKGCARLLEEEELTYPVNDERVGVDNDGVNNFHYVYKEELSKINKREKQGDMHTMGPKSYAVLRHELQQNDPNKQLPSQTDFYMESRKQTLGRTYVTENEETQANIEKMKTINSLKDGSGNYDPYFDVITKEEHTGRLCMYGFGVAKSNLQNKNAKTHL